MSRLDWRSLQAGRHPTLQPSLDAALLHHKLGIQKAISEKLVGHSGFTTHDKAENIIEYVNEIEWCEIILFTYNILNPTYEKAIEAAHAKGIGTLVMNPMAGGLLGHASPVLGGWKSGPVPGPSTSWLFDF